MKLEKILATATFIMIVTVAVWAALRPDLIPRFNLVLLAGLIAVTTIYAYSTIQISRATKDQAERMSKQAEATEKQADASMKMAEEMREQRYNECLPLLVPTMIPTLRELAANEFVAYEALLSGNGIRVMWRNVGKGVAINSQVSFCAAPTPTGKAWFFPPHELGALEVGSQKEVDYSKMMDTTQLDEISGIYQVKLEAEYRDIYERRIATVQEFRVDEENRGTSLGELYFTINGRRLGKESKPR